MAGVSDYRSSPFSLALTVLISICVTLFGGWMTIGRTMVSAEQAKEIAKTVQAPVGVQLKSLQDQVEANTLALKFLGEQTHSIDKTVGKLETKIDILLKRD